MLYQMWMIKHSAATDRAMAQLTKEEHDEIDRKLGEAHEIAGAKAILVADCFWANEEFVYWGITTFPNLESRIKLSQTMQSFGLYQYMDSFTLMGTLMDGMSEVRTPSYPSPLYLLWYIQDNPQAGLARNNLSKEANEQMWKAAQQSMDENQVCMMLVCNSGWCNDAYPAFGLEAYPSLEALQKHKANLEKLNWNMYYPGFSIMGTAIQ